MAQFIFLSIIVSLAAVPSLAQTEDKVKITPPNKELLLKIGATLLLQCSAAASDAKAELVWIYPTVDGKKIIHGIDESYYSMTSGNLIVHNKNLTFSKFDLLNAGEFKCSLRSHNATEDEKVILLQAVKENKTDSIFAEGMTSESLSCSISLESNKSIANITWLKVTFNDNVPGETKVSKLKDSSRFKQEDTNASLIIGSPKLEDAGVYIARFGFSDQTDSYDCHVDFQAEPLVQDFEQPKNLIEGDDMKLQCIVKGYPYAEATWYKNKLPLNISGGGSRHVIQKSFGEHQTVKLLITSVEFADEGAYTCLAYSARFNKTSEKTLTVSVKGKLAALWPFLGIVGEVVVLCTIIFIYENRRNKRVQLEEKAAEEVDGSATDKKEGLRHRNANNPTS